VERVPPPPRRQSLFCGRHRKRSPAPPISSRVHALTDKIESAPSRRSFPRRNRSRRTPRPRDEHLFESVRAVALRLGLAVHDELPPCRRPPLRRTPPRVDENLSLREAHRRATELEDGIRELGKRQCGRQHFISSAWPATSPRRTRAPARCPTRMSVEFLPQRNAQPYDELINCHDVRVRQVRAPHPCFCTA